MKGRKRYKERKMDKTQKIKDELNEGRKGCKR